jgi:hypothetical protein
MSKHDRENTDTSRRNFTKAIVTAAVAAPVVASLTNCGKPKEQKTEMTSAPSDGPKINGCFGAGLPGTGVFTEHIPPMGIDGGNGSLIIETHNKLQLRAGTTSEYEDVNENPNDRYGEIKNVRVITETGKLLYLEDVRYGDTLPDGCQLQLWYQRISATAPTPAPTPPQPADCIYDPREDFKRPADVTIKGGRGGQFFRMTLPSALGPEENTFKCGRPTRYKHADASTARSHFRVGQWRMVGPDGAVLFDPSITGKFEDNVLNTTRVPEHFRFYIFFKDYQTR